MQAKIETLKAKNSADEEYLIYPRTLIKCVTNENGDNLEDTLKEFIKEHGGGSGEVSENINADRLGGKLPSYYINTDNYRDYLNTNVEADFLTEEGHGNLRFYNGRFQYFNKETSEWADTNVSPENVYIVNMIPQAMKSIFSIYDMKLGKNKLRWEEAKDVIVDNEVICLVDKIIVRRKLGVAPENETDGELVTEIKRNQFGLYKDNWFIDDSLTPNLGETWYYKAFPMSTTGFFNYSSVNETSVLCKDYYLFGFRIDQTESDPDSMITYIAENTNFQSSYMDYTTDAFNYGDWTVDNGAWFMDVKPCMLNYDGTVAYYLNPDDYTLKEDGTASDVDNIDFEGNAMIQFPKVYYKCVNISDDIAEYYFSNKKIDNEYHCWSHMDSNGNEIDYCYMPCYNGYYDGTRLRSLSNKAPMHSQTIENEITYAKSNNQTDNVIWHTEVFCDRQLINLLLLLIGKSTDTQTIFGSGYYKSGSSSGSDLLKSGTMDSMGMFYCNHLSVKVFGMEHYWGNALRRIQGAINDYGYLKVKMTYDKSDNSTVNDYNTSANGYINTGHMQSGTKGGFTSKMAFTEYGLLPIVANGSATTYYTDVLWFTNSQINCTVVGGGYVANSSNYNVMGALGFDSNNVVSMTHWSTNASISCKPLATT